MAEMKLYELEMPRSRIYHGEQELISSLTPEQFFALLSHYYDTGFAAGKASAQKEILCMLAADGMPVEKIALLLQMKTETVREIMNAQSVISFSVLEIPKEFQAIAVEFYDLMIENDHPTALLGCRGDYDIAVQMNELTGTMTGGHWFK